MSSRSRAGVGGQRSFGQNNKINGNGKGGRGRWMAHLQSERASQNIPIATANNGRQQQPPVLACLPSRPRCTWELVTRLLQKATYIRQHSLMQIGDIHPS